MCNPRNRTRIGPYPLGAAQGVQRHVREKNNGSIHDAISPIFGVEKKFCFTIFVCNLLCINILFILSPSQKFLFSSPFRHFSVYMRAHARVREGFVRDWSARVKQPPINADERNHRWMLAHLSGFCSHHDLFPHYVFCLLHSVFSLIIKKNRNSVI